MVTRDDVKRVGLGLVIAATLGLAALALAGIVVALAALSGWGRNAQTVVGMAVGAALFAAVLWWQRR